jgi:hypothetical protein
VFTACSNTGEVAKNKLNPEEKKSNTTIEQKQTPNQTNSTSPSKASSEGPPIPEVTPDVAFDLPYTIDSVTIKDKILDKNSIVASFRKNNTVIFKVDHDQPTVAKIIQYDLTKSSYIVRYSTSKNKFINTLISVEDDLFWIEYSSESANTIPWEIKRMKRDNVKAKPTIFASGVSEDQIDPPVLRFYENYISWIEKKITNKVVKSDAYIYNVKTDAKTKIVTQILNEQKKNRDGIFLDLQNPIQDGLLIEQSVFEDKGEEGSKRRNIVFYPNDLSNPEVIVEDSQLVQDYTANEKWIVLTMEGKTEILDRKTKQLKYSLTHDEAPLGAYTPFFIKNQIIYFQSPYIMAIDLTTGNKRKVVTKDGLLTPIYHFGNTYTFSRIDVDKPEDGSKLFFIKEK